MWQATNGARSTPILGRFCAELEHGPKTKFDAHLMLSDFD
jgi:hypothetical protein